MAGAGRTRGDGNKAVTKDPGGGKANIKWEVQGIGPAYILPSVGRHLPTESHTPALFNGP